MPLAETLNPMHMSNNKAYEPQRTNNFEITIYNLPGGPSAVRTLTLAVADFNPPNITNDPIELPHGNSRVKFAGQTTYGGADSLSVIDFIGLDVEKIVNNWQRQVSNPDTGEIGFAEDYKKMAEVVEFAPNGTQERKWRLDGVWPSGVQYGDTKSYDGAQLKRVVITLSYDRARRI